VCDVILVQQCMLTFQMEYTTQPKVTTELVADTELQLYDSSVASTVSMLHRYEDVTVSLPLIFLM